MNGFTCKGGEIPQVKRIAFLGDSITENGAYITHMEYYFRKYMPHNKLEFINLGVSSETVSGLSEPKHPFLRPCVHDRLERALKLSKPEWVVCCYGMNDGIYYPFEEKRFRAFKAGLLKLIEKIKAYGAKVIIMTPPPFDALSFTAGRLQLEGMEEYSYMNPYRGYTEVLRRYGQWILKELPEKTDKLIDLYTPVLNWIEEERLKNPLFTYGDGIHPDIKGHWIIAKTLLRELFNISLEREPDYIFEDKIEGGKKIGFEGKTSQWKGFKRHDFYVKGREGIFIEPLKCAEGSPWIWRTEFFNAYPYADMEMLNRGWGLAYYRLSNFYGCPEAIEMMKYFHDFIVDHFGVSNTAVPFGFSRGGLYAVNYAAAYPEDVKALYLDAPVLDIQSWPGGKGKGCGSASEWKECLSIYGLSEETVKSYSEIPLHKARRIQKAGIPVIIVAGDADTIVPFEENSRIFVEELKKHKGKVKLIVKQGVGHHPHSLENPQEIVKFICEAI